MTSHLSAHPPEIAALAASSSEIKMVASLKRMAERYGKLLGIQRLPTMMQAPCYCALFLIDFETDQEAILASSELGCPLVGLSTLLVSVPQASMVSKTSKWKRVGRGVAGAIS